jgi:hypothetical protein
MAAHATVRDVPRHLYDMCCKNTSGISPDNHPQFG